MQGQYCIVEPVVDDRHCAELFKAYAEDRDGLNWTYLPYGPFDKLQDFKQWFTENCLNTDPLFHAIVDAESGAVIGLASYLRINPAAGSIEVGHIHYSPRLQRTPHATEAMFLMMQRAFDECGYRRYEWKCNSLNAPSRKAALRFGFEFEGIFRQAAISKKRNRDTAWYSMLDTEWPSVKQGYMHWLSADNFDQQGNQKESLSVSIDRFSKKA